MIMKLSLSIWMHLEKNGKNMWIHLKYVMGMLMFQSIRILRNMKKQLKSI
ncbi:Uncharacterised protein [Roseburia hominis]|nr:Uncharacterised protein [Roseburia hominis]